MISVMFVIIFPHIWLPNLKMINKKSANWQEEYVLRNHFPGFETLNDYFTNYANLRVNVGTTTKTIFKNMYFRGFRIYSITPERGTKEIQKLKIKIYSLLPTELYCPSFPHMNRLNISIYRQKSIQTMRTSDKMIGIYGNFC